MSNNQNKDEGKNSFKIYVKNLKLIAITCIRFCLNKIQMRSLFMVILLSKETFTLLSTEKNSDDRKPTYATWMAVN